MQPRRAPLSLPGHAASTLAALAPVPCSLDARRTRSRAMQPRRAPHSLLTSTRVSWCHYPPPPLCPLCVAGVFVGGEENRLEYTPLFERYTAMVEAALEEGLASRVPGFSMTGAHEGCRGRRWTSAFLPPPPPPSPFPPADFERQLTVYGDGVSGDVFDLVLSLGDFAEFKSLMVSWREQVEAEEGGGAGGEEGWAGLAPIVVGLGGLAVHGSGGDGRSGAAGGAGAGRR
jgi:hypothetical protein